MGDLEVEVKVWLIESASRVEQERAASETSELLEGYGFDKDSTMLHRDLYLSHPSRSFQETDEALRIRWVKDLDDGRTSSFLTYKGPKISDRSKARSEIEIKVLGVEDMREILYKLGFARVMVVEKERRTYIRDDMQASIDLVPDLGCFLEAEIMSSDLEEAESEVLSLLMDLGYHRKERRSYLELLLEK